MLTVEWVRHRVSVSAGLPSKHVLGVTHFRGLRKVGGKQLDIILTVLTVKSETERSVRFPSPNCPE